MKLETARDGNYPLAVLCNSFLFNLQSFMYPITTSHYAYELFYKRNLHYQVPSNC